MLCPSCRKAFTHEESNVGCSTCYSHTNGCGKIRCPHCGHESVREPGLVGLVKWIAASLTSRRPDESAFDHDCPGPISLASLKAGDSCIVEKFLDMTQVRKFLSLGVLPGTYLTVLKKEPVVVLRIGYSEFAFDRQLASTVQVHKL